MKNQILLSFFIFWALTGCKNTVEEKIKQAVLTQIETYSKSTLQDIYKNFYQDYFGAEHAIPNKKAVEDYLMHELSEMQEVNYDTIIEITGWRHNFVRIPLSLVKNGKIPADELLQAFVDSASKIDKSTADNWIEEWNKIVKIIEKMNLDIANFDNDKAKIAELLKQNPKMALHHSEIFNSEYKPHYRIVEKTIYKNRLEKFMK
jgi:phage gp36-like protein